VVQIFAFDPADHRDTYRARGWVHVRDGVSPAFLTHLQDEAARPTRSTGEGPGAPDAALRGAGIWGQKEQHLYDGDQLGALRAELCGLSTAMCGLDPAGFTMSERHLKAYDAGADPDPAPHKDRLASVVSVGVSIRVPPESTLVLYPDVDTWPNPFLTTDLRHSLEPCTLPEVVLAGAPGVEIHDRPGDVVVFRGSALWHRRRHSAGTLNLYLKCNDFDCDPLGEDPTTASRAAFTSSVLADPAEPLRRDLVPVRARGLEWTGDLAGRDGSVRPFAKRWERPAVHLTAGQRRLVETADGRQTWEVLGGADPTTTEADVRILAHHGFLDLLEGPPGP
jgi:hypothetical protein